MMLIAERRETMIDIRDMTIDDYDSVYALWMSCPGMGLNDLDDSREGIELFLRRNPDTCLVAQDAGAEIVGTMMMGSDGRRGYIYHTAVRPENRRQGIGRALVDASLVRARSIGINKVALVVFSKNEAGNAFWEEVGFSSRDDLVYRNKALAEMVRIDTIDI